jgi:uncharacterized repeat protein (TIGR03843 family)
VTDALRDGELKIEGRLTDASNATLYCIAVLNDDADADADKEGVDDGTQTSSNVTCVYKPIAGENPLWDFPDGTLAAREVAAYEVNAALGWDVVPDTVLRDGPYGLGMCQRWIDTEDETRLLTIFTGNVQENDLEGWCPIMSVALDDGKNGVIAHRDDEVLRRISLFDAVINNADRKGGHLLPGLDGRIYAIDHGVSFHVEDKLRTLLWGFANRRFTEAEIADLKRIREDAALAERITTLLSEPETAAFHERIEVLLTARKFPNPGGRRRPVPWPLV